MYKVRDGNLLPAWYIHHAIHHTLAVFVTSQHTQTLVVVPASGPAGGCLGPVAAGSDTSQAPGSVSTGTHDDACLCRRQCLLDNRQTNFRSLSQVLTVTNRQFKDLCEKVYADFHGTLGGFLRNIFAN